MLHQRVIDVVKCVAHVTYPVIKTSNVVGSEALTQPPMAGHSMVLLCSCGGGLVMFTSCSASQSWELQFSQSLRHVTGDECRQYKYGLTICGHLMQTAKITTFSHGPYQYNEENKIHRTRYAYIFQSVNYLLDLANCLTDTKFTL